MDSASIRATLGRNPMEEHHGSRKKTKKIAIFKVLLAIIIIAVVVFLGLLSYKSSTGSVIDGSKYQAVFLTNGQVYFGKLETVNSGYMRLSDIYYLQTSSATKTDSSIQASTSNSSNVELIKLGSEVHGPTDEMVINKDQILFFENLKKDGNVTASIVKYQASQKKQIG